MTLNRISPVQWDSLISSDKEKTSVGLKYDQGKLRHDLIPVETRNALARVLTYGAKKYEDNNWRKGVAYSRLLGAAYRHLALFEAGVDLDEESGLRHIDHALCNLSFLATFIEEDRKELDDRYKRS